MDIPKEEIERILKMFGMSDNYIGFSILTAALMYMIKIKEKPRIMKIYEYVAKEYDITVASVEKNIRRSIKVAWKNNNTNAMQRKYFKGIYGSHEYPRNGQFLQMMRRYLINNVFVNE